MTPPRRRRWTLHFAPIAVALLLGSAAPAQQPGNVPDRTILTQAGVEFPERLGNFVRTGMGSVQPGRIDAHYAWPQSGPGAPSVDIYIARVSRPLAQEFAETETMVATIFQELKPVRELAAPPGAPGALGRVWKGTLHGQKVITVMAIDHRDGWRIKIRGTVSEAFGESGPAEIERLIRDYAWWRSPSA